MADAAAEWRVHDYRPDGLRFITEQAGAPLNELTACGIAWAQGRTIERRLPGGDWQLMRQVNVTSAVPLLASPPVEYSGQADAMHAPFEPKTPCQVMSTRPCVHWTGTLDEPGTQHWPVARCTTVCWRFDRTLT